MAVTNAQAKRAVVLSLVGTGAIVVVARASKGKLPEPRVFVALGFVYLVAAAAADVEPAIAAPLAGLIFVGALLTVGSDAFAGVNRAVLRPWKDAPPKPSTVPVGGAADIGTMKGSGGGATNLTPKQLVALPRSVTQGGKTVTVDGSIRQKVIEIATRFHVTVSSGHRSVAHNIAVGGAEGSDHICGFAADFVGTSAQKSALFNWAKQQGFAFVQNEGDHIHISFARCPAIFKMGG